MAVKGLKTNKKSIIFIGENQMNEELLELTYKKVVELENKLELYYQMLKVENELEFILKGSYFLEEELEAILNGSYEI